MSVPDKIKKIVETFDCNLENYKKGNYNEVGLIFKAAIKNPYLRSRI